MKRFFMSIKDAVSLVIKVSSFDNGGELYALDMGEQVLIQDLAKRIAKEMGKDPETCK